MAHCPKCGDTKPTKSKATKARSCRRCGPLRDLNTLARQNGQAAP